MKRIILTIAILFCFVPVAFGAASIYGVVTEKSYSGGMQETMTMTYTVTFGAAAAPPAAVALNAITTSGSVVLPELGGWWLLKVAITYGTAGPTNNTDFRLWAIEDKIDALGDNGLNQIDNATNNVFYPATSTQPLGSAFVFDVDPSTENIVNNATCVITFWLYR